MEHISIRPPLDNKERLKAAILSTTDDLYPDGNGRVIVTGVLPVGGNPPNGDRIYLGEVDENILYQKGVDPMIMINHVRFKPHSKHS